jgi:hypothetical protein
MSHSASEVVETQFAAGRPPPSRTDVTDWNIPRPEAGGVAQIVIEGPPPWRRWRGVAVLAAAGLPALLLGDVAAAAPGIGGTVSLQGPVEPAPPEPAAPAVAPTTDPPPAAGTPAPADERDATVGLDAGWAALVDRKLRLTLADEGSVRCHLLGLQGPSLVCARMPDGLVFTVERSRVSHVYVEQGPRAEPPGPAREHGDRPVFDGTGMIVSGIVATTVGGALAIATAGMAAYCMSYTYTGPYYSYSGGLCPYYTIPLGVLSAAGLGAGVPLIIMGKKRKKAIAARAQPPTLGASASKTRHGVAGTVTIRF